jgi:thioredoxin-dependent peroxiredoxin
MSKKTRKKTRKKPGRPSTRKTSPGSKASAKRAASKTGRPPAKKSSKNSKTRQTKAPLRVSPKASKAAAAKSNRNTALQSSLMEGAKAPSFELPRDGGNAVSLADFSGQKIVLFFYPRADTPGCTKEAIDFTRLKDAFAAADTAVVGVSGDPLKAQEAFRNKHQLSVPLASDEKHEMLAAYGAWGQKSMYGRTFMGILRTTVLIGADGKIIKIWRHVKVDGHADEVLAAAQAA